MQRIVGWPNTGREATGSACIILRFDDDGMILRLGEYIDGRPFAPLFK